MVGNDPKLIELIFELFEAILIIDEFALGFCDIFHNELFSVIYQRTIFVSIPSTEMDIGSIEISKVRFTPYYLVHSKINNKQNRQIDN